MSEQATVGAAVSEWPNCLETSLMKAQLEFPDIPKDKVNKFYDNQPYTSLDAIVSLTRPALAKFGLVANHKIEDTESGIRVTAVLKHVVTKEQDTNSLSCGCDRNNPQRMGSVITYLRRYTIAPLLGVTPDEDDDGNSAIPAKASSSSAPPAKAAPPNGRGQSTRGQRSAAPAPKAEANFSLPADWPETTVENIIAWVDALTPNVTTFRVAFGSLKGNVGLFNAIEEWEPVFLHFGKRLKSLIEADWPKFAGGVDRATTAAFIADVKAERTRLDLDKQGRGVFGDSPSQGTETNATQTADR